MPVHWPTDEQLSAQAGAIFTYKQAQQMNIAFARAMIAARYAGLENFTLGPVKMEAPEDMVPTYITRSMANSLMGSGSALCADDVITNQVYRRSTPRLAK